MKIKKSIRELFCQKLKGSSSSNLEVRLEGEAGISKVFIHVDVFSKIIAYNLAFNAKYKELENAGILTGLRIGELILITGAYQAKKLIASNVDFTIPEEELIRIDKQRIKENQPGFVGIYHLHPGFGSFLSTKDVEATERFDRFYGKSVNLVISIRDGSIEYGFFTVQNGKPKKLDCEFLVGPSDV